MSLLIKALQKAEQHKANGDHLALQDELPYSIAGAGASSESSNPNAQAQQAAGLVFSAKNLPSNKDSLQRVYVLAGLGLLLLAMLGGGFYYYLNALQQPEMLVPKVMEAPAATIGAVEPVISEAPVVATEPEASEIAETASASLPAEAATSKQAAPASRAGASRQLSFGEPVAGSDAAVKVARNAAINVVNPVLFSAYRAFTIGDNTVALRLYRQVLQADTHSVDALLGMAAIAARQGRVADAAGWYGKVLEIEPGNTLAQSALLNSATQSDPVSRESRIKSLLAQQPESAELHAALGSLYTEQNQWASAQQAYFQAYHLEPNNANHVYNLAICLDQLGKPQLALRFYKETQTLLASVKASDIDQMQLERRIAQLQQ